jgi:hypothetical protein
MSALSLHLDRYLKLRWQLGYKLHTPGSLLRNFVRFADEEGATFITTKLAVRWAAQPHLHPRIHPRVAAAGEASAAEVACGGGTGIASGSHHERRRLIVPLSA